MALSRLNDKWCLIGTCDPSELSNFELLAQMRSLRVTLSFSELPQLKTSLNGL